MDQKTIVKNESLTACTMLFQLFGQQYFSLSARNLLLPTSKLLLHKIVLGCIILYVLFEAIGISIVIGLEQNVEAAKNNTKLRTGFLVQYGSYFYMNFVMLVTTLHAWFNTAKAMKIFNQLERIQKLFETETGCAPKYDDFIKRFKTVTIAFVAIFTLMTVCTLGFIYYHNKSTIFYWALLVVLPYVSIGVTYMRICFLIEIVNINLLTIYDVLNRAYNLKQIVKVEEFIASVRVTRDPENETIFNTIIVLKRIYGLLYEASLWINENTGVASVLQLLVIIIGNSSAGYKFFLVFSGHMPIGRLGVPVYTMLFTYGMLGLLVVYACSCYETSLGLLCLVHKFEFSQYERQQQQEVSAILSEFAAQMSQQQIKFTFCGYFGIEKSFLAQIILTILTYQIILSQFQ